MPNGTSGHFHLKRSELIGMVSQLKDDQVVGHASDMDPPDVSGWFRPITASALKQIAGEGVSFQPSAIPISHDEVFVTEQDQADYILHFKAVWVSVEGKSPLYTGLAKCHREWKEDLLKRLRGEANDPEP